MCEVGAALRRSRGTHQVPPVLCSKSQNTKILSKVMVPKDIENQLWRGSALADEEGYTGSVAAVTFYKVSLLRRLYSPHQPTYPVLPIIIPTQSPTRRKPTS